MAFALMLAAVALTMVLRNEPERSWWKPRQNPRRWSRVFGTMPRGARGRGG